MTPHELDMQRGREQTAAILGDALEAIENRAAVYCAVVIGMPDAGEIDVKSFAIGDLIAARRALIALVGQIDEAIAKGSRRRVN